MTRVPVNGTQFADWKDKEKKMTRVPVNGAQLAGWKDKEI